MKQQKIKKGDIVFWTHKPYGYVKDYWFEASGFVLDLDKIIVGGCRLKKVAKIYVNPNPYWEKINRKTTTISVDKLRRIK